jgi:hypothetical protein
MRLKMFRVRVYYNFDDRPTVTHRRDVLVEVLKKNATLCKKCHHFGLSHYGFDDDQERGHGFEEDVWRSGMILLAR